MLLVAYLRESGRKSEAKAAVESAIIAFSATSSPAINPAAPPQGEGASVERDSASIHHTAMLKSIQAELLVETVLEQQKQASPWKQTWSQAKALLAESEAKLEQVGAVSDLVRLLLNHSMLTLTVSPDGDTAATQSDLEEAIGLLEWAEEQAEGVVQTACPPDLNPHLNLPCQRLLADVQLQLARTHVALAWGEADIRQSQAGKMEITDKVQLWLVDTKPKELPTEKEMKVGHVQRALMYATSAHGLLGQDRRRQPDAAAEMGRCLKMLAHEADESMEMQAWTVPANLLDPPQGSDAGSRPSSKAGRG
jgi:hypothetical protein